jgi:ubiquinone/menaquinone biosynthesis C-methylase UbiE
VSVNDLVGSGGFMSNDEVSKEWDNASKSWADFVRTGKDICRDEMNNPAFFKLLGNVKGKQVLDLSCGEGYNTRILAKKGARVTGVDFSKEMIKLAKQSEKGDRLSIKYYVSHAADLRKLESDHFDVVTCFMALMDIENYEDAISEVARVLNKHGKFVFSIIHPCFEYDDKVNGEPVSEWVYHEGADDTFEGKQSYLKIKRYFGYNRCVVSWGMKRLVKPFQTTSFHRTLTDYFQTLHRNGFVVSRLVEPKPTSHGVLRYPSLRKYNLIPLSLIIEAIKN